MITVKICYDLDFKEFPVWFIINHIPFIISAMLTKIFDLSSLQSPLKKKKILTLRSHCWCISSAELRWIPSMLDLQSSKAFTGLSGCVQPQSGSLLCSLGSCRAQLSWVSLVAVTPPVIWDGSPGTLQVSCRVYYSTELRVDKHNDSTEYSGSS